MKKVTAIGKSLKDKKDQIDDIKNRNEALTAKFHELCPEGSTYHEQLYAWFIKITKKKWSRAVKEEDDEGDDGDDNFEEEDFDEDDDDNQIDANANFAFSNEEHKIDEIDKLRDERMKLHDEKMEID